MKTYVVTFTRYYSYQVEADNDQEAEDIAYKQFYSEQTSSVADTSYDELEIECCNDENEEEYYEDDY